MGQTTIQWTNDVWNPLLGCSRVSLGCGGPQGQGGCYAEKMAWRLAAMGVRGYAGLTKKVGDDIRWTGEVHLVESVLDLPLLWKRPRRIFVNSMSDLFHEKVPDEWIDRIFSVMALAAQHTFQVLTKRPERMLAYLSKAAVRHHVCGGDGCPYCADTGRIAWALAPYSNVWLGVSVEDQATADERIPLLLQTPAALRWVSYEPALADIDFAFGRWLRLLRTVRSDIPGTNLWATSGVYRAESNKNGALSVRSTGGTLLGVKPDEFERLPAVDWLVCGGESGSGARPFDLAWARSAITQCRAAGVPVFCKQLGAFPVYSEDGLGEPFGPGIDADEPITVLPGGRMYHRLKLKDRKGADWNEWGFEDLRVREWPL